MPIKATKTNQTTAIKQEITQSIGAPPSLSLHSVRYPIADKYAMQIATEGLGVEKCLVTADKIT